jgi:putative transposase
MQGTTVWSSAAAHLSGLDESGVLDMDWWREQCRGEDWARELAVEETEATSALRRCTYAGRPFGSESLVRDMSQRFGRCWRRGRPKKEPAPAVASGDLADQLALF